MKILIVVGARPNFMKAAPIVSAIEGLDCGEKVSCVLVHTGQHYDQLMSDRFFADLNLRKPDIQLGVGSGSHAVQTAEVMKRFEEVLLREQPDVVVVVGDVNSTIACALVAAKITFGDSLQRPLVSHVEAGLRSFDRGMPEEINRILTDHLSDVLFVTERSGLDNLAREGVAGEKVHLVGNTMIDSLVACKEKALESPILDHLGLRGNRAHNGSYREHVDSYILLTLHRPANVDRVEVLLDILDALETSASGCQIVFPAHPRTQKRIREFGLEDRFKAGVMRMIEPLGYVDFLSLMSNARLVVTDSGGIQEETTCLGIPCVTVRDTTERPVTVDMGTNVLAGLRKEDISAAVRRQLLSNRTGKIPPFWDGRTAERIVQIITRVVEERRSPSASELGDHQAMAR